MANTAPASLATFLKDRRTRLDPAAFGFSGRRRTPGLRREEVAQRANISATWYTWLEQGRGGAPSADVLNRISGALMLTEPEREHLYLLALGRPPQVRYKSTAGISPRLQRLLDLMESCPAILKTPTWDIIGWNRAATVALMDYRNVPPEQRNILRILFRDPGARARSHNWEGLARFAVGSFRAYAIKAGAMSEVGDLVEELCRTSPEFEALWRENEVLEYGEGTKRIQHPTLGEIEFEHSGFAVDGRPDLALLIYNPVDPKVAQAITDMVREEARKEAEAGTSDAA
jgi:transcriptional regulator with XRE-family HTH domain